MAVNLRTGIYGQYWGSFYNQSGSLSSLQKKINAIYIYNYLNNAGWTLNSIAGVLGNMERESYINPGCWQSGRVGFLTVGYSLVQWTPGAKYVDWLPSGSDPSEMDNALSRIIYELNNNLQWISTTAYPMSFQEFTQSLDTPENLASAFLKNYERAGVSAESIRRTNARKWYEFLGGISPIREKKNKFKWVLYANKLRNR